LSQQELSERLLVDKSNMTSMIDGLEKLGFVTRNQLPGDRRFYRLLLTESGAAFLDGIEKDYRALIHRILARFSPDEMKQLTQFMVRMQTNLKEEA